jgi:hypothetical protein
MLLHVKKSIKKRIFLECEIPNQVVEKVLIT